jgi:hypothetical protein
MEDEAYQTILKWWAGRRLQYNLGLIAAGLLAFALYCILGITLIAPHDHEFEVTLFTTAFQGMGYLLMMLVANVLYNLGPVADQWFNRRNDPTFRKRLFDIGFWFSFGLPFLVPLAIFCRYLVRFSHL